MTDSFPRVKAAVVQAAPILFNREASVEKACRLTVEAAAQGARLILFVTKTMYPAGLDGLEELADQPEVMCRGGSTIISPLGEVLAGPLYGQEGTLFADLDLAEVARGKFDFDVVGHYTRPDVFQLLVNERATPPVAKKANEEMGWDGMSSNSASSSLRLLTCPSSLASRSWVFYEGSDILLSKGTACARAQAACLFGPPIV